MFSLEQYEALRERAGLLDRTGRGRLQLTGADRRAYLHGLLTNDIVALSPGEGCYAALLTPQGRMISDMRVSELGDRLLIDLPGETSETVRQRLADFIFSEDVEVTDVRGSLAHVALYGPRAADVLAAVVSLAANHESPANPAGEGGARRHALERLTLNANARWDFEGAALFAVRSDDYGIDGFELFTEAGKGDRLADALRASGAADVSPGTVDVCRVEAGRPEFGVDMDEHTIPLEAGIEDRAISFSKGCYVGQEVIIRVLHRGHGRVAKRLVGLLGAPEEGVCERGERLLSDDGGKEIGSITSAVRSPRLRRPVALGYVQRAHAEAGTILRSAGAAGGAARSLTVTTLPSGPL